MLEYEFETVAAKKGSILINVTTHKKLIQERARQGWRYTGWIPTRMGVDGPIIAMDLIFEREQGGRA